MKTKTSITAKISKRSLHFFSVIYLLAIGWTSLSCFSELYRFKMENSLNIFPQDVLPDTEIKKTIKNLHM